MICLPTFTIDLSQMQINILCMDGIGCSEILVVDKHLLKHSVTNLVQLPPQLSHLILGVTFLLQIPG